MKKLEITCDTKLAIPYQELNGIQGALKILTKENFAKLRKHILNDGINFALHVWKENKKLKSKSVVKWWIIDGHGRHAVIRYLIEEEKCECGPLPCVEIQASSFEDAKRKVLNASSAFNTTTKEGLYEFISELGLSIEELETFSIPEIHIPTFRLEFYDDLPNNPDPNSEWNGMPEFHQEDKMGVRSLIIHFKTDEDVIIFSDVIKQNITNKTRSLWFPKSEIETLMDKRYESES